MKNLALLLLFIVATDVVAQEKKIFGTFVFEDELIGYEFTRLNPTNGTYDLSLFKYNVISESAEEEETVTTEEETVTTEEETTSAEEETASAEEETASAEGGEMTTKKKTIQNIRGFDLATYETIISQLLESLFGSPSIAIVTADNKSIITNLFFELKAKMEFEDTRPKTGFVVLQSNKVKAYKEEPDKKESDKKESDKKESDENEPVSLYIQDVEIQFFEGTIYNLIIKTSTSENENRRIALFRNNVPISISTKFDPEKFLKQKIYYNKASAIDELGKSLYYIKLNEILRYEIVLSNSTEDYSPADTIINLKPSNFLAEVYKEKTSKILSARTYTDLSGLSNDKPNGLIQIEVFKKISLNTRNKQATNETYFEGLKYITPKFSLNKIEENERYLPINDLIIDKEIEIGEAENGTIITENKSFIAINPIDLVRYKQFEIGAALNILVYSIPKVKFLLDLNYSISQATMSFEVDEENNFLTPIYFSSWGPTIYTQLFPDHRYGIKLGFDASHLSIHQKEGIASSDGMSLPIDEIPHKWNGTGWFLGNYKTSEKAEMFFRTRYNFNIKNSTSNYWEIQLGYAFDILKKN